MRFRPITPGFGVEVHGLDPSRELDDLEAAELRRRLDDHGVLLFRDIDIDTRTQYRLACLLADDGRDDPAMESRPSFVSNREPDSITPFGRLPFHTDLIWGEYPFRIVSLYAIEVEPPVVPTLFASAADAWATLPAELRSRVDGREAVQANGQHMAGEDIVQLHHVHAHSRTTPIGFPHPRTGRTILLVDQQSTRSVVGMTPEESAEVLDSLRAHLYRPEALWSHEWREGDLAVWDNLAVQHARANVEVEGVARTLRRACSGAPVPTDAAAIRYGRGGTSPT
jgi:alpha-ketoglutarate-dependent taurine dioxygenase